MDHYINIQLRPDPEIAPHQLMSALFVRLHKALVEIQSNAIGVSFPEHDESIPTLGQCLRLHGSHADLTKVMALSWLKGVQDYTTVSDLFPTPAGVQHRSVSRVQTKSNVDRLRRRAMRRHGLTAEQASERIPITVERKLQLPFITVGSSSTKQAAFPLFVSHSTCVAEPVTGRFNSYGLSLGGTVPWF